MHQTQCLRVDAVKRALSERETRSHQSASNIHAHHSCTAAPLNAQACRFMHTNHTLMDCALCPWPGGKQDSQAPHVTTALSAFPCRRDCRLILDMTRVMDALLHASSTDATFEVDDRDLGGWRKTLTAAEWLGRMSRMSQQALVDALEALRVSEGPQQREPRREKRVR